MRFLYKVKITPHSDSYTLNCVPHNGNGKQRNLVFRGNETLFTKWLVRAKATDVGTTPISVRNTPYKQMIQKGSCYIYSNRLPKIDRSITYESINLTSVTKKFIETVVEHNDSISASEALFGFAAWLTTRDTDITAGSTHDAAVWAEVVGDFCDKNNLEEPRVDFTAYYDVPDEQPTFFESTQTASDWLNEALSSSDQLTLLDLEQKIINYKIDKLNTDDSDTKKGIDKNIQNIKDKMNSIRDQAKD